jgi:peptidoglycan hydrolase CwlO-like protein
MKQNDNGFISKSDEMMKSLTAQLASQATAIYMQTKSEMREMESQLSAEIDWLKMQVEDLEEARDYLQNENERERETSEKLRKELEEARDSLETYKKWWLEAEGKISQLKSEKEKSDAATSDQGEASK